MSRSFVAILRALCLGVLWMICFATTASAQLVELGANDFRVSNHSGIDHAAQEPDVAWDSLNGFYLAVWSGGDDWNPAVGEYEIYGRLIYPDGSTAGGPFRISFAGPNGDQAYDALAPAVVSNGAGWVVAWFGSDDEAGVLAPEREIFVQPVDMKPTRVSDMGGTGDPVPTARTPDLAYNPDDHEILVVWEGNDGEGGLATNEREIFVQRLDATTFAELGVNDRRISDMGGLGNEGAQDYYAERPAVVYNPNRREYLVAWSGSDSPGGQSIFESEIFVQRLDASGAELGVNDQRISDKGGIGDYVYSGYHPAVAYDPTRDVYLVVWYGGDDVGGLAPEEVEVFGQLLDGTGAEIGVNDFRISDMGGTGNNLRSGSRPDVVFQPHARRFLVAWQGGDFAHDLADGEFEIFAQWVDGDGTPLLPNDVRISDMGPALDPDFGAAHVALGTSDESEQLLAVWVGEDLGSRGGLPERPEIFGQLLAGCGLFCDGFESGDVASWDAAIP